MRKNILKVCAAALLASPSLAMAEVFDAVRISGGDTEVRTILLADNPSVSFHDDGILIKAGALTLEYPLSPSVTFELVNSTSLLLTNQNRGVSYTFGSSFSANGLPAGSYVAIYNLNGACVAAGTADSQGSVTLPLEGLAGVLIVRTVSDTFKIIK